jgi:hypothetical protein
MKNAYQRRRVKARVEKRARMMKLDAITLDFARQVIEEETGAPLDIKAPSADAPNPARAAEAESGGNGAAGDAKLIARDERKNPLISTFEWTNDAAQRILRVPAGFMRNQTQERIEELARERGAVAIDLALVEDGIEFGKRMMAEMIANYPSQGKSPGVATAARDSAGSSATSNGNGYLNEVSARPAVTTERPAPSGEHREG